MKKITHSKKLPLEELNNLSDSICKISAEMGTQKWLGTGFFMKIKDGKNRQHKCLITTNIILLQRLIVSKRNIRILTKNGKEKIINFINYFRFIKYFGDPIEICAIEIFNIFEKNEIKFLNYDLDYIKNGYNTYLDKDISILYFSKLNNIEFSSGKIKSINDSNKNEFIHSIGTSDGSSGSPIILIDNFKVIGIQKENNNEKNNIGTFIGKFVDEIKNSSEELKSFKKKKKKINSNKINEEYTPGNNENNIIKNEDNLSSQINEEKVQNTNGLEYSNENNIIILRYSIFENENNKIKILNKRFVFENKNNFEMFINEHKYELLENLDANIIEHNDGIVEIKLKQIKKVESIKCMFENCNLLPSSDFSKWDTSYITDMSKMFYNCKNLSYLPDISTFNTRNVVNMSYMFSGCMNLLTLPDISKFNTSKVENMEHMFSFCEKIKNIPDISKWNIENVKDLSCLFYECKSLEYIPDISKWKIDKVTNMNKVFYNCKGLKSVPDLRKWFSKKNGSFEDIFSGCETLIFFKNIIKSYKNNLKKKNIKYKELFIFD